MKEKVHQFLQSDILERYLLGETSTEEYLRVERYLALYPEVRDAYGELQENLEAYAKMYAQKAPENLKGRIMAKLRQEKKWGNTFRWAIAASFVALFSIAASYFFYDQNKSLQEKNSMVSTQIKNLEMDMKVQLEDLRNQYIVLNNPNTKRLSIQGNKKARDLKAIAYINPVKKLSYINVSHLPQLPKEQCYQMWTEVNGELVSLGIIKAFADPKQMLALPYGDNAVSYITIEPKGGNRTPSIENIVANIEY